MDNEASSSEEKYKAVEYLNQIYRIPVRRIDQDQYLFLSDVQAVVPQVKALTSSDKLIPFVIDPITHLELTPRRVYVSEFSSAWQVHVPKAGADEYQQRMMIEMNAKLDRLSRQLHHVLSTITSSHHAQTQAVRAASASASAPTPAAAAAAAEVAVTPDDMSIDLAGQEDENAGDSDLDDEGVVAGNHQTGMNELPRPQSPPPAFSSSPPLPIPTSSSLPNHPANEEPTVVAEATSAAAGGAGGERTSSSRHADGDAPPSYETSILGNIKALTDQLRLYESHIANRHKSPRWLARRSEWVQREPTNIEQLAYQLVQLEMALLWTAVSESWIQERETWLTLVASARTERHLAGAMISLERHTLVLDENWVHHVRETWINELLEMIVLPLTHGN